MSLLVQCQLLTKRPALAVVRHTPCLATFVRWNTTDSQGLLYEGPLAKLTLRLKIVSVSSTALSVVGIPLLIAFHSGDVPAMGQIAVGATTILGAAGSTVAMSFCFSPYIHKLEKVPIRKCHSPVTPESLPIDNETKACLLKATTRNLFAMKVETVFDPATDVSPYLGLRPFCNFQTKGVCMYIHPELIHNETLRKQLLGDKALTPEKPPKQDDDDDFL